MATQDYVVNPYNFQVPVSEPKAFAGRKSQREEIEYYLDQASKTRPTNIAIVGPRAAGKTSLLNMIERDANERGIVAVRINFDESHARSQLRFFFKIFDALLSEVLKQRRASNDERCFGGRGGRFFELYIQCISNFERVSPDELELLFPNLYASAMKAGNDDRMVVPSSLFEDDLQRIAREVGRPIALIMDECNVLAQNREILQAMRGMFQNLDRYMLVLTGTNEMFPVIDDVYSPVGRGFKRISLEGFVSPSDTFACMERPCVAHGVSAEVLDLFRPRKDDSGEERVPPQLADLHMFTAGNPHEIQLACHFMFRDLQERVRLPSRSRGRENVFPRRLLGLGLRLDSSVIGKVLKELAPDEERRETLGRVQALDDSALAALGLLTRVGFGFSRRTYEGFVESERAMDAQEQRVKTGDVDLLTVRSFNAGLDSLLATGWLCDAEGEGGYRWVAPQLEEVLLKYVARSKRVFIGSFGSKSLLEPYLARVCRAPSNLPLPVEGVVWLTPWTATLPEGAPRDGLVTIPHRLRGRAFHALYDSCEVFEIACSTPERGWSIRSLLVSSADLAGVGDRLAKLEQSFVAADDAARSFGVRWSVVRSTLNAATSWGSEPGDWTEPLEDSANLSCPAWMGRYHQRVCAEFLAKRPLAHILHRLLPQLALIEPAFASNFGFVAVAYGLPDARESLKQVVSELDEPGLARYNLALAALFAEPEGLSQSVAELRAMEFAEVSESFAAMLLPKWRAGEIRFEEWTPGPEDSASPPLKWFVDSAIGELEAALASGAPVRVVPARQPEHAL